MDNTGVPVVVACCGHVADSEYAAAIAVAARGGLESLYAGAGDVEEGHVADDAVDEKYPAVNDESATAVNEGDVEDVMVVAEDMGHHSAGMEKERTSAVSMAAVLGNECEDTSEPAAAVVTGPTDFDGVLLEGKSAAVWAHGGEGPTDMGTP